MSTFDLGRWAVPVRWAAMVWSIFVVGVLTVPDVNHKTALMAGGFFLIAAVWYALRLRGERAAPREALREPESW